MSRTCYMTFSQGTLPTRCGRSLYVSFICVLMCVRTRIPKRIVKYPYLKLCVCDTVLDQYLNFCVYDDMYGYQCMRVSLYVCICVYMCLARACPCM